MSSTPIVVVGLSFGILLCVVICWYEVELSRLRESYRRIRREYKAMKKTCESFVNREKMHKNTCESVVNREKCVVNPEKCVVNPENEGKKGAILKN